MGNNILWIVVVIVLLVVGVLVIPRLTRKAAGKLYKKKSTYIKMDLSQIGPEIVRKSENSDDTLHQK